MADKPDMKWTHQDFFNGCLLVLILMVWGLNRLTGWMHKERNPKSFWWIYGIGFALWAINLLHENWRE